MDRRDALKKLGMGGATIVGASVIVSSPAFAATVNTVTPTVTVVTAPSEKSSTFTITQPNPTCGGSATGLPSRISNFTAAASRGTYSSVAGSVALAPDPPTTTTLSLPAQSEKFAQGETATITVTTTFTCIYARGPATACRIYTFAFTYNEVAKNFQLNGGAPGVLTC